MNRYGEAALQAVGKTLSTSQAPGTRWDLAVQTVFPTSLTSQKKHCPKSAFLGLCEEGLVRAFPRGKYTSSKLNKSYAIRAVRLIRSGFSTDSPRNLWLAVMNGQEKSHNSQMDVVIALWENGFISEE